MQHRQFRCALVSCAVAIGESGEIRWCHFDADGTSNTIDVVAVTVCRSANGNLFFFFSIFPIEWNRAMFVTFPSGMKRKSILISSSARRTMITDATSQPHQLDHVGCQHVGRMPFHRKSV